MTASGSRRMPSTEDVDRFGVDPLSLFRANLAAVEERMAAACARAGRDRASVRLLPITKTVPVHILRYAFAAGIRSFGENKIQEASAKREALADLHKELRDLRFQDAVGQFTATSRPREIRKAIARIHTIRTEKETAEA